MVRKVKKFKAGFVVSDSNLRPDQTLLESPRSNQSYRYSTLGDAHDGTPNGILKGMVTGRDYRLSTDSLDRKINNYDPF